MAATRSRAIVSPPDHGMPGRDFLSPRGVAARFSRSRAGTTRSKGRCWSRCRHTKVRADGTQQRAHPRTIEVIQAIRTARSACVYRRRLVREHARTSSRNPPRAATLTTSSAGPAPGRRPRQRHHYNGTGPARERGRSQQRHARDRIARWARGFDYRSVSRSASASLRDDGVPTRRKPLRSRAARVLAGTELKLTRPWARGAAPRFWGRRECVFDATIHDLLLRTGRE